MANPSEIVNDPDFINANAATKQAIFAKHVASNPEFLNAPADAQQAIKLRFGFGGAESIAAPTSKPVVVKAVPMGGSAAPAVVPAPDSLVTAFKSMKAGAPVAAVAPAAAAPAAAAPAVAAPMPRQANESPKAFDQRMAKAREEADKAAREAEKAAREAEKPQVKNEGQGLATGFGMRMKESNAILNAMEDKGIINTGATRSVVSGILGAIPAIGGQLEEKTSAAMNVLPSWAGGPNAEQQQVEQARRNFITAVLRKESGAVISPQEFYAEEKKYFPQLGDEAPVIQQKRAARDIAIRAMDVQSGNKAPSAQETAPPPSLLKEGHVTTFANGQQWSMRNGKAERVK